MAVYDDDNNGGKKGFLRRAEEFLDTRLAGKVQKQIDNVSEDEPLTSKQLKHLEDLKSSAEEAADQLGKGYKPEGDGKGPNIKKIAAIAGIATGATGAVGALIAGFLSLNQFRLFHIMENMDASTFARYQGVSVEGRSREWIKAYMTARLLDIEKGPGDPGYNGNIMFRADKNFDDTEKGAGAKFKKWYDTMRGLNKTYNFESKLFGERGIKFTSIAFYDDKAKMIKVRPALISVNNTKVDAEVFSGPNAPNQAVLERALNQGDITALQEIARTTGKIDQFIDTKIFGNDVDANKELKRVVNEAIEVRWFSIKNRYQRHVIRKDIARMTGIRDWQYFAKTREKLQELQEKKISVRNKFLDRTLPSEMKAGLFLRCLFGVNDCHKPSEDPINKVNDSLPDTGIKRDGDKQATDAEGKPVGNAGDGSGQDILKAGKAAEMTKLIASKANPISSIISLMDQLARFDKAMRDHKLSGLIALARSKESMRAATIAGVMLSQAKTGELTHEENGEIMNDLYANTANGEAWQTVIEGRESQKVAAQTLQAAQDKAAYCSLDYQDKLEKPENRPFAERSFAFFCDKFRTGGTTLFALIEAGYTNTIGLVIGPLAAAFGPAAGTITQIMNSISNAITPNILGLIGLEDNVAEAQEAIMGYMGEKAMAYGGGGPMMNDNTPSGQVGNIMLQGWTELAEKGARSNGLAETNEATKAVAEQVYSQSRQDHLKHMSFNERYLSLNNHESIASRALFKLVNRPIDQIGSDLLSSVGGIFTSPLKLLSADTYAANTGGKFDPYGAATFMHTKTYDISQQCLTANPLTMTPASSTNADEQGIFTPDELTWTMLSDKEVYRTSLYDKVGDDDGRALRTENCAMMDDGIADAMGAAFGYKGANHYGG